jgi:hypothetical protein
MRGERFEDSVDLKEDKIERTSFAVALFDGSTESMRWRACTEGLDKVLGT